MRTSCKSRALKKYENLMIICDRNTEVNLNYMNRFLETYD